ncbi:MAG: hypothetical protein HY861_02700 [Chlamydiia bacterium]|nr:hypothetical protein [Chlamydiia bacterium]
MKAFLFFLCVFGVYGQAPKIPVFSHHGEEIALAIETAKEAGALLLASWNQENPLPREESVAIHLKSNELICKKLLSSFPDYGLITKEPIEDKGVQKAISQAHETDLTWVVDPLNGTPSFVAKGKEFGVHIALLERGTPILGIHYYPVAKRLYVGVAGCGAYKQLRRGPFRPIHVDAKSDVLRPIVSSRKAPFVHSFYSALLGIPLTKKMLRKDFRCIASSGLRLCQIAEGKRNIDAIEAGGAIWDLASGYVILKEAGGEMGTLTGEPLNFLAKDHQLRTGALCCGSKSLFERASQNAKSIVAPP